MSTLVASSGIQLGGTARRDITPYFLFRDQVEVASFGFCVAFKHSFRPRTKVIVFPMLDAGDTHHTQIQRLRYTLWKYARIYW